MNSGGMNGNTMKDPLTCAACKAGLRSKPVDTSEMSSCPSCGADISILAFPALVKGVSAGKTGELLVSDDESGCFYHPGKKAVVPCSSCGRYLCALCDVEMNGEHLCPPCIEAGKSGRMSEKMVTRVVRYDSIAMSLAILPLLIFPLFFFSFITAPAAAFVVIRYWKAPRSLVAGGNLRFVFSFVFAVIQFTLWCAYFYGNFVHRIM